MNRLGRVLWLTLGLSVATASVGHFYPSTIRAVDIERVKVINSASDPVPVTGGVKASQNGTWNVGITGTPSVNVASAPPANVNFPSSIGINGTVPVQNAPGLIGFSPFIVQDFENPARTAYQATCFAVGSGAASCKLPQLPPTKTLVIDTVSANVSTTGNATISLAELTTAAGNTIANHFLAPILIGNDGAGTNFYAFNSSVRIYADPGSTTIAIIETANAGNISGNWTISGHFVCKDFQQLC